MLDRTDYTVLLIDDEQSGLQLRELVLESVGFNVLSANTGDEGMSLFRMHDVDVVITDHLLGRLTASGLASTMKRLKPHVPIVSLSGTTNATEALMYADKFVGKAEGPETLISTIDSVLARRPRKPTLVPISNPAPSEFASQELLAAIIADSSDAILSKTLDGTITSWNHAAENIYGYKASEVIGQSITILLPADRPDEVAHILSRLKRGERIFHFETVRVAKSGRRLDVALTISPIRNREGELVGASTIARDVTAQKTAEEALRKAEKLALAGRMAATIAHEINNPLEAIGNVLYLLKNVLTLDPDARKFVEIAQDELKRVSEIAKLTLGMQRGGSDRNDKVEIRNLIENVLTLYQGRTKTLGIVVKRKYKYEGGITGSTGELRQVFSNLVVNAMDALSISGDKLAIKVSQSRRWDSEQRGIRVSIFDNGPGISPEHRSQLFQAFYTTKGEQGTGIGLWVSKSIVMSHGGTLKLHSSTRPGRTGTCFSVFLPVNR